jgi:hypothetical protein
MSKEITNQATNRVNIVGKLLDVVFRNGKLQDGRDYESANMTIRVTQTYGGREEVSEIPVSMFAAKYTLANKLNPGWDQLQSLHSLKTAQNVGIDEADTVRINSGNIRENNFVAKSGQLINGWQLNTSFISSSANGLAEVASFVVDLFIMDMHPEEDRDGDSTGRLVIKGGIVQYNGILDVVEFIVENPEAVDYIERNWNVNDTVTVRGRIRMTVQEEKTSGAESSWGEDIPEMTTKTIRELIITKGDDQGKEEEFAYDATDIKKAFNVRKAKIEQMQLDAKSNAKKESASTAAPTSNKYSWE